MTPDEKVRQRRSQMLVHSYLYYWLDSSVVSDHQWQKWANELAELQKGCSEIGFYDKEFEGWDGTTGHHLPVDEWVKHKANQLVRYHSAINQEG